jgi:Pilus formation protein N terminal region
MVLQMLSKAVALIATVIIGASFGPNCAAAQMQTQTITSDATAQFLPIELNKFLVMELPGDAREVLIANPKIANVVMRTTKQATILGIAAGQTTIAFYDGDGRQIEALDVSVHGYPVSPDFPSGPEYVVTVFGGASVAHLSCTSNSNLRAGAVCYPGSSGESANGQTVDELPHGSQLSIPVGK